MYNLESVSKNETHKILWDFVIITDCQISARRLDTVMVKKKFKKPKKKTCRIVDFIVQVAHSVKPMRSEKGDKYLDLARELNKTETSKTMISIAIGVIGTVTKGLIKGQEETIRTTVLLRSARIRRRVLEH